MTIEILRAKIHRAVVTDADLHYRGSITVDKRLMEESGLYEYERVQVLDINNGERLETYVIQGEHGSGTICLNGAAARRVNKGDRIIILAYEHTNQERAQDVEPTIVYVDDENNPVKKKD